MTTQTLEKETIQAKDGKIGQEYLWINAKGEIGARTLLAGMKDGKAIVKFWVEGYDFETQAHTVSGNQLLRLSNQGGKKQMPKEGSKMKAENQTTPKKQMSPSQTSVQAKDTVKAPAKTLPKASVPEKASKPIKERIAKKAPGEKTPRVELCGFSFRKDYRSRLSPVRASFCQKAVAESCSCRCAGSLHGKDHQAWFDAEEILFQKSPNGAITALQVLNLVKKFGGVVVRELKKRGRKPLTGPMDAEKAVAKIKKTVSETSKKVPQKAPIKAQIKPQAKAMIKAPAKTKVPA